MSKNGFSEYIAVVDFETLAIGSDACILSIGLTLSKYTDKDITFKQLVETGFSMKFDLVEQRKNGRSVSDTVVAWWFKQDEEARKVLKVSDKDVSIYTLYDELCEYFSLQGINLKKDVDLYDRRSFDISKMEYLFVEEQKLDGVPWDFKKEYEISTALRFLGYDRYGGVHVKDIPGTVYHDALHDSAVDHLRLLKCLHASND